MLRSKILLILSIILLVHSQGIIYSGVSNYYSDNYINKSLLNEINSISSISFNLTIRFSKYCTPSSNKALFFKNKIQSLPVNNTSTYNLKFEFSNITSLNFVYQNGVYQTYDTLPLKLTRKMIDYGDSCSSPSARFQDINIIAQNITFKKVLINSNGVLTPQVNFSVKFNLHSVCEYSLIDPQITRALNALENAFENRINALLAQVQLPLVPQIYYIIGGNNYSLNLNLLNLATPNPSVDNGDYTSVLSGGVIAAKISAQAAPYYYTDFVTSYDSQFFISQTTFSLLYLQNLAFPAPNTYLTMNNLALVYPSIKSYYPANSVITAQFLTGKPQFDSTQTFSLNSNALFNIYINGKLIISIDFTQTYKLISIEQATSTNKATVFVMDITSVRTGSYTSYCNCGSSTPSRVTLLTNSYILPWISKTFTAVNFTIENFFNHNFGPQIANLYGNNILLSSNYNQI